MKEIHEIVAYNLKAFRTQNRLSLENVSKLTGVSKTMLSQIERGDSIPTITTIWKIAKGLKLSFTELVKAPTEDITLIKRQDIPCMNEDGEKYRLYPYFPFDQARGFEMYQFEIDAKGQLIAEPHQEGSEEYIMVTQGELTLTVGQETYTLGPTEAIRFNGQLPHRYQNLNQETVKGTMTISYS